MDFKRFLKEEKRLDEIAFLAPLVGLAARTAASTAVKTTGKAALKAGAKKAALSAGSKIAGKAKDTLLGGPEDPAKDADDSRSNLPPSDPKPRRAAGKLNTEDADSTDDTHPFITKAKTAADKPDVDLAKGVGQIKSNNERLKKKVPSSLAKAAKKQLPKLVKMLRAKLLPKGL